MRGRQELVRLVRTPDGAVMLDARGKLPGRGAYVCPEPQCLEQARRRLGGALRANRIDFAEIRAAFAAAIGDGKR